MKTSNKTNILVISLIISIATICLAYYFNSDIALTKNTSVTGLFLSLLCLCVYSLLIPKLFSNENKNTNNSEIECIQNELYQLNNLLESEVKDDLIVVKEDLTKIKSLITSAVIDLMECFNSLSTDTDKLHRLVNLIMDAITGMDNKQVLSTLENVNQNIRDKSAVAIRSLQFEDIVVQISDNSVLRVKEIENFLVDFSSTIEKQISDTSNKCNAPEQIRLFLADIEKLKEDRKTLHNNNIIQKDLSEGSIELF